MKLLVINGPNLNMLGIREPKIYGSQTYDALCANISKHAVELGVSVECYQSNYEGDLVTKIQDAYFSHVDGIVLNPAAYTHTSVALLDALKAVQIPTVEVHISRIDKREEFRQISYVRPACVTAIWGHGFDGYLEAMDVLVGLEKQAQHGEAFGEVPCEVPGNMQGEVLDEAPSEVPGNAPDEKQGEVPGNAQSEDQKGSTPCA